MTFDLSLLLIAVVVAAVALVAVVPVLAVARPPVRVLLSAYAFVLPFGSALEVPGIPAPFNSLSSLVGVAVAALLCLNAVVERRTREWTGSTVAWILLVGWLGLTMLWSLNTARSLDRYVILLSLLALYVVACLVPVTRRDVRWMEVAVVLGATCVSLLAVYQAASGQLQPQPGGRLARFAIETGDPNITAASLLLPWVLTVWAALNAERFRVRLASFAATTLITSAIVLTGSRGALVSAVGVLLVIVVLSSRRGRLRSIPSLLAMAVAVTTAFVMAPDDLRSHLLATGSSGRTQIWSAGLAPCADGCWIGYGYGAFSDVYRTTYLSDLSIAGFGDRQWAAHNVAIGMYVDGGLIALALLVAAFALLLLDLRRLPRSVAGPAIAAVAALVASNMLLSNLGFKYFWFTLLYGALTVSAFRASMPSGRSPARAVTPAGAE